MKHFGYSGLNKIQSVTRVSFCFLKGGWWTRGHLPGLLLEPQVGAQAVCFRTYLEGLLKMQFAGTWGNLISLLEGMLLCFRLGQDETLYFLP